MSTTTGPTGQKKSYKSTLNLPKTAFPMKANLVQNEPASLKRWERMGLYQRVREARGGPESKPYVFHDGPPYANGAIHLGHLLNKVVKDLIVRSKTMAGYDCPYIPGWDCHGLPIEHKVMQNLGDKARGMNAMQIRRRCKTDAEKFVKLQSKQMQRLLTLADYENPYLTVTPGYEAGVLEVFAELVEKGLVYRALKPVHWSIANRTALADAELEYYDREDTSVYVLFEAQDGQALRAQLGLATQADDRLVYFMIWTTTPWTLPANLAVAVHPRQEYGVYDLGDRLVVVATGLAQKVSALIDTEPGDPLATFLGEKICGLTYRHPFIDDGRQRPVVSAEYVTLEDGTGLVHTAPGHGVEDYQTGLREGLEIYCPVREDGTFGQTAPDWLRGADVWQANEWVVLRLRKSGHLFHAHKFTHSYPHDWRSKTPVIFRATEQWFVAVDRAGDGDASLRDRAMGVTADDVTFIPGWGRNRMRGMLESRPDWCISRQRAWGLPIPAFLPPDGVDGDPLLTAMSVRAVSNQLREHGSDFWFTASPEELLAGYDPASDPDAPDWVKITAEAHGLQSVGLRKSRDIFDVWFESGSSWNAVLRQRDLGYPADLYLEGSDQHRGWFQLSLLPALGATGQAPFRGVLTHGFMVDRDGKKMSKSGGNALEVEALLKDFGADVCRWWVASLNTDNDIKVDLDFFKTAGDEYRKVRNTIRFLLSNLYDFDPQADPHAAVPAPTTLDAWALGELKKLIERVHDAYETFRFRKAHEAIFHFCNETMSSVYLTAVKDRLYCDPADGPRRRRTQAAMYTIADHLIRLLAPIVPHTADEAWRVLHPGPDDRCVHLELLPELQAVEVDPRWATIMAAREEWLKAIETARQQHGIDNPLDCGLVVPASTLESWDRIDPVDCADLCGISRFEASPQQQTLQVMDLRDQPRCERSWKRDGTVEPRSDGGLLSGRDAAALGLA